MAHYTTNGLGRDSYIYRDNGGFTAMYKTAQWPETGALHTVQRKPAPNPVMHSKPIFYRADGNGRDMYVVSTSGGNFSTMNHSYEYRDNFKRSLRSYERLPLKGRAQRPIFSAKKGLDCGMPYGKEDQKIWGNGSKSVQKLRKEFETKLTRAESAKPSDNDSDIFVDSQATFPKKYVER